MSKTKKGNIVNYSYTKDKKSKSVKWQLRVDYTITSDRIKVKPYIVVTGDGFKESTSCTIKIEYKEYKKTKKSNSSNWINKWVTSTKSSTHKIKSKGTYKVFFADKKGNAQWISLKTYKVNIVARIGSHSSVVGLYGTKEPPKPQLVTVGSGKNKKTYGLEHSAKEPYIWNIWFEYDPKGDANDYAAPVNYWAVWRLSETPTSSGDWGQPIKTVNTNHDANGFQEKFQNPPNQITVGSRYKWKVAFGNDAGLGPARIYPVNETNESVTITDKNGKNKTKVITQNDKIKEWAYAPPKQISSVNVLRHSNYVTLSWSREPVEAHDGYYQGYFFQYLKDRSIDDVSGRTNSDWTWATRTDGKKYKLETRHSHASEYDQTLTSNIGLKDNHRYILRLVPFNYDKGYAPNKITTSAGHIQIAKASEPTDVIYFKPCAADSITAVYKTNGYIDVTIKYDSASGGSVNCAKIERRYRYSDNTESNWYECYYDGENPPDPNGYGIDIDRLGKTYIFTDYQPVPTTWEGKTVTGVKYRVKLGVNEEGALAPTGNNRFSSFNSMSSWVSSLKKPNKPTLLFPENDKAYPETTEIVSLTWVHNSNDGTGQEAAKLDIFVLDSSIEEIPYDFFSYSIWESSHPARNSVSIEDDTAFYNLSFSEQIYKITDIDTSSQTVTYTQTNFAPNDKILWRASTKGAYNEYSDYSTEQRIFHIFGSPSIDLRLSTPNTVDCYYNVDRTELASDWLWVYFNGSLSPAPNSVSKQYKIIGWCDNLGNYTTGEDATGYSYLGKDYLWDGNAYVNVEYPMDVLTQIPATISWTYNDLSGTLQGLTLYLIHDGSIVEQYIVDLTEDTSYTFTYLFDNEDVYTIMAEATSSTTLTATEDISFIVSYTPVELKKTLSVTADFDESTGFAMLTLAEEVDEGVETDSAELQVVEEGQIVTRAGTAFNVYFDYTYEDNHLIVKSLLDKPVKDITFGCSIEIPNFSFLYPDEDIYPNILFYPQNAKSTDDHNTDNVIFEGDIDPSEETINIFLTVNSDKGILYAPVGTSESIVKLNFLTGEFTYLEDESTPSEEDPEPVVFPIKGTIYDEFDEVDQPDVVELEDEIPVDVYLYRIYRDQKTYIGHFNPNFEDDETIVATITDRFCPINREFEYQLIQVTDSGHIAYSSVAEQFDTLYWYCYWGPTFDNVAKARWNPIGSASYSRPERQSIRYSGRKYPVIYDSDAIEETYSFNVELVEDDYMIDDLGDDETALETIELYREMMLDGGVGFWKSFDGDVYFATFDFSYSIDYTDRIKKYPCSLSVTRIEGNEVF